MRSHAVLDSPIGPLVAVDDDGALARFGTGATDETCGPRDDDVLPALREQLDAYWAGALRDFDLPLAPKGTPFQQRVWSALQTIPYGQTRTYKDLAEQVGQPTAVRAVGAANGRNPLWLIVPCHRVIGSSGKLVGYAGGLDVKRYLLDHERGALF